MAYAYLVSQAGVDGSRVGVGGASCGAMLTADLAMRQSGITTLMLWKSCMLVLYTLGIIGGPELNPTRQRSARPRSWGPSAPRPADRTRQGCSPGRSASSDPTCLCTPSASAGSACSLKPEAHLAAGLYGLFASYRSLTPITNNDACTTWKKTVSSTRACRRRPTKIPSGASGSSTIDTNRLSALNWPSHA